MSVECRPRSVEEAASAEVVFQGEGDRGTWGEREREPAELACRSGAASKEVAADDDAKSRSALAEVEVEQVGLLSVEAAGLGEGRAVDVVLEDYFDPVGDCECVDERAEVERRSRLREVGGVADDPAAAPRVSPRNGWMR